ncbi:hypothetical protein [Kordiimonas lacus]|uniref:Phosphate-selective porin O and P n=1 Tax=Kordiimonas lacus TaxID=637679 RepID=A0A1G6VM45_9PROT|nr:hypothetical protein [Kordiimonas lacus]SDD54483.1 hypothetical protein SAMN04488071_0776 [Kordiimonas lacus]
MDRPKATPLVALSVALALCAATAVEAEGLPAVDFEVLADARLSVVSGEQSWFDDWLGKLRYGGDRGGEGQGRFRLAELSLMARSDITWDLQAFVHAKFDPEQDKPADLVEAFLHYKPVPTSSVQYEARAGLLFPHISRENIGAAWTSPFTITPSAINSWVGEEIRALALEGKATLRLENQKLSLTAAVFGFNDPAGSLLAIRGWALGDYKTGAFSQVPLAPVPSIQPGGFLEDQPLWVHPVRELDGRPGFYASLDWDYAKRVKLGAFYYDNRGDPETFKHNQYAWDTRFWNFYAEVEAPAGIKIMSQFMTGNTMMGTLYDGMRMVDADFTAGYVMATRKLGPHRISLRRDWFDVDDNTFVSQDNNNEVGTAWTLAFNAKVGKKANLIAEFLHVDSNRPAREGIWRDAEQDQTQLQVSYRQRF